MSSGIRRVLGWVARTAIFPGSRAYSLHRSPWQVANGYTQNIPVDIPLALGQLEKGTLER